MMYIDSDFVVIHYGYISADLETKCMVSDMIKINDNGAIDIIHLPLRIISSSENDL